MCPLEMSLWQSMLLIAARQMTKKFVLSQPHHAPGLKRLVYENEMRDHLVMMGMNSIVGRIIMIRLGALPECLITPHPGWPSYSGQGSESLEGFFDQVEEYTAFYGWDGQEACHQARAHLKNMALSYVKCTPFAPRTCEELKALLLKRFQPRDLTATYKAQFRARRRRNTEEIYSYVEALQRLVDMAWPFMDHDAKEDLVVDQLLQGMDSHELSDQVATSGCRHLETVLRIARSLEAVHEEKRHHSRGCKPSSQACFVSNERGRSPDPKELVKEVLAQLGHGPPTEATTHHQIRGGSSENAGQRRYRAVQ